MKRQYRTYLLSLILLSAWTIKGRAQTFSISYTNTQTIVAGTTITPLTPAISGGSAAVNGQTALLAGSVGVRGSSDGATTAASFSNPIGMAMGPDGNIYVADAGNYKIRKITSAGAVTTFAGTGGPGANNGGALSGASFNSPFGICFDQLGNMYVADYFNNLIRKITPSGTVSTYAGNGTQGYQDGLASQAEFNNPTGVAADALGNVYVADYGNHMIRKITPDGTVSVLAGQQTAGYADLQGTAAKFGGPQTIALDPQGDLIVADKSNNMIRLISPNGTVSTLAGQLTAGYADATGTLAKFSYPAGIAIDPSGNIYVPDYNNNRIRMVSPSGVVTTLSGTGVAGPNNGAGNVATFSNPYGVTIDKSGNLYVSDFTNLTIRKVLSTAFTISPALPAGLNFNTTTGVISGAAISYSPSTTYTITAYNLSASAQTTLSFGVSSSSISSSQNMNYIATYVPRVSGLTDATAVVNASPDKTQVQTEIKYFDGLGRPIQTVKVKGSPNGRDLVQPIAYDSQSREAYKYLPYAVTGFTNSDGSYKTNALTSGAGVLNFYNPTGTGTSGNQQSNGIVVNPNPYGQTVFETSPLSRIVEQGAPGAPWQPIPNSNLDHTVKTVYSTNNTTPITDTANTTLVALYTATVNSNQSRTLARASGSAGNYDAGQLFLTITYNENWTGGRSGTVEEYKDMEGHVVLKRTFNYLTSPVTLQILSTYYVYDDLGNLTFVLTPQANADGASSISQATLDNLCYQYRYDERGRLTQKKVPGKGWEYLVYNQLDQPVMSQDSVLRVGNQWNVTKYDGIGRVVITGIWNAGSVIPLATLQTSVYSNAQWDTRNYSDNNTGYTVTSYPSLTKTLTANYYDNYINLPGVPAAYIAGPAAYNASPIGILTGSKKMVLNTINNVTPDMLWQTTFYDDLGRNIQSYSEHYLGGVLNAANYDQLTTTYNFTNQPTSVIRKHFTSGSTTMPMLLATNTYLYDHMGRKTKTWEQLTYGSNLPTGNILISQTDYNEIGQLLTKHLHSTDSLNFLQNVAYTYNERGWLLSSSAPLFAMQLYYNTSAGNKLWNGNIMYQYWGSPGNLTQHYAYAYDGLNRLIAGSSTTNNNEYPIYDLNGNITALNRGSGSTYTPFDQLSYNYINIAGAYTNQVQSVADANASNTGLPTGTTNFTYDGNGNMVTQQNTGINHQMDKTVTYNLLNLPQRFIIPAGTLTYTYDASGNKLRKVIGTNTVDYINGIQYTGGTMAVDFIQTEEGKASYLPGTGGFDYYYYLGDNLGNTRLTFETASGVASKYQRDNYYPFGMEIIDTIPSVKNEYLYNKKELQEELTQYDYGARFYDPVIGRWNVIDPLAETNKNRSSYNYAANNPIKYIDPDGMDFIPGGGQFGGDLYTLEDAQSLIRNLTQQQEQQQTKNNGDKGKEKKQKDIFVHNKNGSIGRYPDGAIKLRPDVRSKLQKQLDDIGIFEQIAGLAGMLKSGYESFFSKDEEPGAARARKYSSNWGDASLEEAINKFAPDAQAVQNGQKILYTNDKTGIQVVYDEAGNYFRIQDTKLTGKRQYLDMNGNIPNNKTIDRGGRQVVTGRSQPEYNEATHFNNSDN